ncbi:hypothetical protein PPL_05865 [Heterostelium album PN500]|uniref:Uncharacterized protein n=1 Tax=Heterostelium pallidum (strain ATCC 26659 / Pp 5 / PN500) TaxID=670386 RepID=D3BBJ7_HETP5|nr:hypothetical protein PPL_05865 [Heterostelium album PN500]EFA81030.1 hypothetical protein PPL_05865 [Heterostelium album PN500]|eukprot:XP_020433148.1 hypothetical protein PPL_05865 [Heterostelium album PN500]
MSDTQQQISQENTQGGVSQKSHQDDQKKTVDTGDQRQQQQQQKSSAPVESQGQVGSSSRDDQKVPESSKTSSDVSPTGEQRSSSSPSEEQQQQQQQQYPHRQERQESQEGSDIAVERLEESGSGYEDYPSNSGISDISTIKKKNKTHDNIGGASGVFSNFFKRKNPDEKVFIAQKEKLDKMAKDIKSSIDSFTSQFKHQQSQSDIVGNEYQLPSYFDSMVEQLSDVLDTYSDKEKILKRHIRDIENRSTERSKHWRFWANLISRDPSLVDMVNTNNFLEISSQSIFDSPLDLQELRAFEELLTNTLNPGFNNENVANVLSIQKRILPREHESTLRNALYQSKSSNKIDFVNFEQNFSEKNILYMEMKNIVQFWQTEKEEQSKKLTSILSDISKMHNEKQSTCQSLAESINNDTDLIRKHNIQIRELAGQIEKLKKEIWNLEEQISTNTKKLEEHNRDDRPELQLRKDSDIIRSRHDTALGVYDLVEKFHRGYVVAFFNYKKQVLESMENRIQYLEKIRDECNENNQRIGDAKGMDLVVEADRLLGVANRISEDENVDETRLDNDKKRISSFIESMERDHKISYSQIKRSLTSDVEPSQSSTSTTSTSQKDVGQQQQSHQQQQSPVVEEQQQLNVPQQQQPSQQQQQQGGVESSAIAASDKDKSFDEVRKEEKKMVQPVGPAQ